MGRQCSWSCLARCIPARSLDADKGHGSKVLEPGQQPRVARVGGLEALHAEEAAPLVERSRDVELEVRINAAGRRSCQSDHSVQPAGVGG